MFKRALTLLTVLFFISHDYGYAYTSSDTLVLTLPNAEKIFLEKNLELLAAQFDININQAYVQQARLWDNPVLNTDQNIYDGKFFRHDANYGQVFVQIQQLIKTAGKRNKLITLAKDGVLTSQQQFNDLMRNLQFLLRTDFYSLHQLLETNNIYNRELQALQKLVTGMDAQLQAGNISLKENIRIRSLLFSLQADQADLQRQLEDMQKDLHVLLQLPVDTVIVPSLSANINFDPQNLTITQLLDSAFANRPDLQLAQTNVLTQQHNLSYQKALVVPDLTVGLEYDQRSSYIANYYGLAISLPLPILNNNKGNIKAATYSINQAKTNALQIKTQSEQEVASAYKKLLLGYNLQKQQPLDLTGQYDQLLQKIITSYEQRQVGLLEFIDFFDSYKDSKIKSLQQETTFRNAAAEINFATGSNIINNQ
ncbi:MAG: TolC family protein [Bacteroidetes bacterium]|nr:TolC family protein [Bacteroidota bacterium]